MSKFTSCEDYVLKRVEELEERNVELFNDNVILKKKLDDLYEQIASVRNLFRIKNSTMRDYHYIDLCFVYDKNDERDEYDNLVRLFNLSIEEDE